MSTKPNFTVVHEQHRYIPIESKKTSFALPTVVLFSWFKLLIYGPMFSWEFYSRQKKKAWWTAFRSVLHELSARNIALITMDLLKFYPVHAVNAQPHSMFRWRHGKAVCAPENMIIMLLLSSTIGNNISERAERYWNNKCSSTTFIAIGQDTFDLAWNIISEDIQRTCILYLYRCSLGRSNRWERYLRLPLLALLFYIRPAKSRLLLLLCK